MKYVLLGSLGHITKPLAQELIAAGHSVTIVSSNPARSADIIALGATPAIGSVEDTGFLTHTFRSADAVYTMIPPRVDKPDYIQWIGRIGEKYAAAIKAAGIKKVVNLSSMGADQPAGIGFITGIHHAEQALDNGSGADIRHVRAGSFYTNLLNAIGMIKGAGIYGNNYGADTSIVLTHPRDIAAAVAEELQNPGFKGSSVRYVASDERSSREITAVLGQAIGKPQLRYVPFSDEEQRQGLLKAGFREEIADGFVEMGVAIRTGLTYGDYRKHRPTPSPTRLEDFAKEFAAVYE
jgi:uncharacterized protein YbjT (DUF2867 family)